MCEHLCLSHRRSQSSQVSYLKVLAKYHPDKRDRLLSTQHYSINFRIIFAIDLISRVTIQALLLGLNAVTTSEDSPPLLTSEFNPITLKKNLIRHPIQITTFDALALEVYLDKIHTCRLTAALEQEKEVINTQL